MKLDAIRGGTTLGEAVVQLIHVEVDGGGQTLERISERFRLVVPVLGVRDDAPAHRDLRPKRRAHPTGTALVLVFGIVRLALMSTFGPR